LSYGTATTPHQTYSYQSTNPYTPNSNALHTASTSLLFDTRPLRFSPQPHHISLNRRHGEQPHTDTTTLHMLIHLQDVDRYRIRSLQLRLLPRWPQLSGRVRHKSCRERRHRNWYPMQGWRSVGDGEAGLKQAHEEGRKQAHRNRRQTRWCCTLKTSPKHHNTSRANIRLSTGLRRSRS
jgi:hypothetical protein